MLALSFDSGIHAKRYEVHTSRHWKWLRWGSEPAAYAHWVDQTCHASEGIPERGAEDVGVIGLLIDESVTPVDSAMDGPEAGLTSTSDMVRILINCDSFKDKWCCKVYIFSQC